MCESLLSFWSITEDLLSVLSLVDVEVQKALRRGRLYTLSSRLMEDARATQLDEKAGCP
jgi:hypothetical protein